MTPYKRCQACGGRGEAVHDALVEALKGMFEAHESYSNEFRPGGKIKAVADWGLINDRFIQATQALKLAGQVEWLRDKAR